MQFLQLASAEVMSRPERSGWDGLLTYFPVGFAVIITLKVSVFVFAQKKTVMHITGI